MIFKNAPNLFFCDFETYFAVKYSLTTLSYTEYVNHPDFMVYGASIIREPQSPQAAFYDFTQLEQLFAEVDWPKTTFICHNAAFDAYILKRHFGIHAGRYIDTAGLMRAVLQGEPNHSKPNSIAAAAKFLGIQEKGNYLTQLKGKKTLTPTEWDNLAKYAINDVEICRQIFIATDTGVVHKRLRLPLDEYELMDQTIKMFVHPKLIVNQSVAQEALDEAEQERKELIDKTEMTEEELGKDELLAQKLRDLGVEPPTKQGKRGTIYAFAKTDNEFEALLEHPSEAIPDLVRARRAVKSTLSITRAKRLLDEASRGPLPVFYKYWGAHTNRWSGDNKLNLQNLTRGSKLRLAIEAPEGYVIVVVDLSQIEVRVLYALCNDIKGLNLFVDKLDPYNDMASNVFMMEIDRKNNPDHFTFGHIGKCLVLGCGYGMGPANFQYSLSTGILGGIRLDIDLETAQKAVWGYRAARPKIVEGWKEGTVVLNHLACKHDFTYQSTLKGVSAKGDTVWLPGGTYLRYPDIQMMPDNNLYYRQGTRWVKIYGAKFIENITQAVARNVFARAMMRINKIIPVVGYTHDECIGLAPESRGDEAFELISNEMTKPVPWLPNLPLAAEGGYARNYSK